MTELIITPKVQDKTARFEGAIAAGEHVAVTIKGGAEWIGEDDGANLVLRVIDLTTKRTLAVFPRPPETLAEGETFAEGENEWDSDESDLTCKLNLNTARMVNAARHMITVPVLFVLGDTDNPRTLYFRDQYEVEYWPERIGDDVPYDLDRWPKQIDDWTALVAEWQFQMATFSTTLTGHVGNTGIHVTAEQKAAWTAKQSAINDLEAIRAGAAKGATALQQHQDISRKADLVGGKVPQSQLPSYVDDVLEYASAANFPATGETGKIYVAKDENKTYRWSGTQYVQIGGSSVTVDPTLSVQGAAADAKATGDALAGKRGMSDMRVPGAPSIDRDGNAVGRVYLDGEEMSHYDESPHWSLHSYEVAPSEISAGTYVLVDYNVEGYPHESFALTAANGYTATVLGHTITGYADELAKVSQIPAVPVKAVKKNGTALTPDANGAVDVTVPTKTSDLTNDGAPDGGGTPYATTADATLTPVYSNWVLVPGIPSALTGEALDAWRDDMGGRDNSGEVTIVSQGGFFIFIGNESATASLVLSGDGLSLALPDGFWLGLTTYLGLHEGDIVATRSVIGYTLGDQATKPLQPQGEYAPATNIAKAALASDVQTSLGKADTAVQPAALDAYPTKAQLDAGWWSEWVISTTGSTSASRIVWKENDPDYGTGWYPVNGNSERIGNSKGDVDSDEIAWTGSVEVSGDTITATRHRVAAPVPTKPSDIGAQPAGNYATAAQLRYDLGTEIAISSASSEVVEGETVTYGEATLADRTANRVAITAAIAELQLTFPAAVSGKVRDFGLRVEVGDGTAALTAPALVPPAGVTLENADGAIPALADGAADAKGVTLLYFSETAPGKFLVKGEEAKEVA